MRVRCTRLPVKPSYCSRTSFFLLPNMKDIEERFDGRVLQYVNQEGETIAFVDFAELDVAIIENHFPNYLSEYLDEPF